ncbi:hypothetical protein HID58_001294, partial [Brassica napus]
MTHLLHQSQNRFDFSLFPQRLILHRVPNRRIGTSPRQSHRTFPLPWRPLAGSLPQLRHLLRQRLTLSLSERERSRALLRRVYAQILSPDYSLDTFKKRNDTMIPSNQLDGFGNVLMSNLSQAVTNAVSSPRKFDARKAKFTTSQTVYLLVQCTPDLTDQDCLTCLRISFNQLPQDKIGGRFILPSCNSRFETYPFYNQTAVKALPPPPPPPVSAPERPENDVWKAGKGGNSNMSVVAIVVPVIVVVLLLIAGYCFLTKRKKKAYDTAPSIDDFHCAKEDEISSADSLQLDYRTILAATNDFSESNNIGRGGFGEVYKGTLPNGTEVAVKRLSKTSGQGDAEFKNEVAVVAKLQHRNLARLLGFCIEGKERILVYDGYMSPEYAMRGQYSMKSDVYSFGVLVLEIISGKKNSSFFGTEGAQDLVTYAWRLWKNQTPLDLVAPVTRHNCEMNKVVRCIHIGLLCVQEDPAHRPTLSTIVMMLSSNTVTLPVPKQPKFFAQSRPKKDLLDSEKSTKSNSVPWSIDNASITELYPPSNKSKKPENIQMSSYTYFIFLFLFPSLLTVCAQNHTYVYHNCPNTTTYSSNSTYSTNLRTLLSSLSSPNASYSTGFQNATVGQTPDRVAGLFLCRGDVSPEVCRSCVAFSVNDSLTRCPNEREAVLYYDECMLRYSHRRILSTLTRSGEADFRKEQRIPSNQLERFSNVLLSTLNQAVTDAVKSSRKFDARKANVTASLTVYGLVQCTPDMTRQDCTTCLQISINQLPIDRVGGSFILPNCNSRFETYPFYNETAVKTPQPPPTPLPVSAPVRPGKGGKSNVLVVPIVVSTIVVVLLLIAGYCFFTKRKKEAYDTAPASDGGDEISSADSLQLDYKMIQAATNGFSESNNIGRGGFGEVYKGTFPDGTEVAAKRFGYMSPEYAMHGQYSMKSDVYSFGVLVLEIISGKKNSSFFETEGARDLVTYAWRLWRNETPLELVAPVIVRNCQVNKVVRCIHIGLLCVQEDPANRPTLSTIVMMLSSNTVTLPVPKQPKFFAQSRPKKDLLDSEQSTKSNSVPWSIDDASITELYPLRK